MGGGGEDFRFQSSELRLELVEVGRGGARVKISDFRFHSVSELCLEVRGVGDFKISELC